MFRIRFHGRGGQGMKTSSRILGKAFFLEGYEVQDAPRYGAERRGAPIFAYVRASKEKINERGIIRQPGLVVVADESLVALPAAGILQDCDDKTVILINTAAPAELWQDRLNFKGKIVTLSPNFSQMGVDKMRFIGAFCAGSAARLTGVIQENTITQAITEELSHLGPEVVQANLDMALSAFKSIKSYSGMVKEGKPLPAHGYRPPAWIELSWEPPELSAPAIHAAATSEKLETGKWRTMRPIIDYSRCNRCWWLCSTFCPDGAISLSKERYPQIDYIHCKGCLICLAQCPTHAVSAVPESEQDGQKIGGP